MADALETRFDLDAAPLAVAGVMLFVKDLDRMVHFYSDVVGLEVLIATPEGVALGQERPFLTLQARTEAPVPSRRAPGLFHTAFLLPDRADLGAWLRHAAAHDVALDGASDHNVSEALYLSDPEGNGIEIYADRPPTAWAGPDGRLNMSTDSLDLDALPATNTWAGAPKGTRIGHIHLRTTDLPSAEAFWTALGLDVMARYPGASFFGAGGYHHQIAANVWSGRGQPPRTSEALGLASITLEGDVHEETRLVAPSGVDVTLTPRQVGISPRDPEER